MRSPLGIYVHLPFCESKCHYCNFASGVYPESMVAPYLKALKSEILNLRSVLSELNIPPDRVPFSAVDTIYFGGGTPSLVQGEYIIDIVRLLGRVFDVSAVAEITLEVNPGSVDERKIQCYRVAGVNRVSIGMQAFQDEMLKHIGRSHTVQDALSTLELFRKTGVRNISLDIIAGLPGQTAKDWRGNLDRIQFLSPEHLSMYMLEIHEHTIFGKIYGGQNSRAGVVPTGCTPPDLPNEDLVEQFYFEAVSQFEKEGYGQYEISNFARPGYESRHNLKYWTDQSFIGFGCSAYSYFEGKRWGNERSVARYMQLMRRQQHAIDYRSDLTARDREEEAIFLGLRLTQGIDLLQFENKFGFDLQDRFKKQIEYLKEGELIEFTPGHIRLTPKGWMLSNEVFSEFLQ
jgi:oxygen-independent coproporphyrinogen III oxidase